MKKIIMILFLLVVLAGAAAGEDLSVTVSVDWQLGIQGGIEYRFNDYLGIRTDLGITVMGLAVVDLYATLDPGLLDDPWHFTVLLGVPNFAVPFTFDAAMLSLGGAVELSRDFSDTLGLGLRAGVGFPLFFEEGKEMIRDIQFPLDLWPELALAVIFQ